MDAVRKLADRLGVRRGGVLASAALSGAIRLAVAFLGVVFSFYLAGAYDLRALGAFTLAMSVAVGLSLFSRLGFDKSILKLSGKSAHRDGTFYRTLTNTLLIAFCLGLVVVLIAQAANARFGDANPMVARMLRVMLFVVPFMGANFILAQYFNGIRKPQLSPLYEPTGCMAALACVVMLTNQLRGTLLSFDAVAVLYLAISIIATVAGWLAILYESRRHRAVRIPLVRTFSQYRGESLDFFIGSASAYLITLGLFPVIGLFLDNAQLGFFRLCERLSSMIRFVLIILNSVLAPRYAKAWSDQRHQQLFGLYWRSVLLSLAVALPLSVAMLLGGETLIRAVSPEEARVASWSVLTILVVASFLDVLSGGVQLILNMTGHHGTARNIYLVMLPSGLAMFALLSALGGVEGAAVAYLLYTLCLNLLAFIAVWRRVFVRRYQQVEASGAT